VIIPLERLLIRLRQPKTRADELAALRVRLRAERQAEPSAEERAAALEVRRLKRALADATGAVTSCSECGKGMPPPGGAFAGGHCCSGRTEDLFNGDEVAMLAQCGTRPADLVAPRTEHAGCAFRAPTHCTLTVEDRPALCARYACNDLRRELFDLGRLDGLEALEAQLDDAYRRFSKLRASRLDDELLNCSRSI